MSLGLSLAAATNNSQLLVSSLGHRKVMRGMAETGGGWGVGMGVEEEGYALEAMLTVVASVFRLVVQLHRQLVQRTCMQKVPASF